MFVTCTPVVFSNHRNLKCVCKHAQEIWQVSSQNFQAKINSAPRGHVSFHLSHPRASLSFSLNGR